MTSLLRLYALPRRVVHGSVVDEKTSAQQSFSVLIEREAAKALVSEIEPEEVRERVARRENVSLGAISQEEVAEAYRCLTGEVQKRRPDLDLSEPKFRIYLVSRLSPADT